MRKEYGGAHVVVAGAAGGLVAAFVIACGSAPTPPPLTPDGPDMDPDAAVYQDDATTAPTIP